jgi:hypothetical protein
MTGDNIITSQYRDLKKLGYVTFKFLYKKISQRELGKEKPAIKIIKGKVASISKHHTMQAQTIQLITA